MRLVAVLAAAGSLALAGCSGHTAQPMAVPSSVATSGAGAGAVERPPAEHVELLDTSFVNARRGWALEAVCRRGVCRARVLGTVTGGRNWVVLAVPPVAAAVWDSTRTGSTVGSIEFANHRDGWIYGEGLWATDDGGRRWRRVALPHVAVLALAASARHVYALVGRCQAGDGRCAAAWLDESAAGTHAFGRVTAIAPFATQGPSATLATRGESVFLIESPYSETRRSLWASPDGAVWRHFVLPTICSGFAPAPALAAWTPDDLALICAGQPGAGNQMKWAYISHDGGASWHHAGIPGFAGYIGSLAAPRYPDLDLVLSGIIGLVLRSTDAGRRWTPVSGLASGPGGDGWRRIAFTGPASGTLLETVPQPVIWTTSDGGASWTRRRVAPPPAG